MSQTIFDQDNSNLSDSAENSSTVTRKKAPNAVYQLVNSTDQDVDFTLQGTRIEDDFSEAVDLQTETVTTSENQGYMTLNTDEWEKLRVNVDPNGDPTSGSVQVHRMAEIS